MKKNERYNLINHAIKNYNEIFNLDYKPVYKSKKNISSLLKQYPRSSMCYWSYCCCGLYQSCWQDFVGEGHWGMTQEKANEIILNIFTSGLLRKCRNQNRMFWCEKDGVIHMVVIARDLYKEDYLITFSKEWI